MRLSIIMPVYNIPCNYLKIAVDSVIRQEFTDFELLCIDDASQIPENLAMLERYAANDRRIKIFHLPENRGAAAARNFGLEQSAGEYIAFLDGDDYVDKNYYRRLIDLAEQNQADMVLCGFIRVNDSGKKLKVRHPSNCSSNFENDGTRSRQFAELSFALWNKLYRHSSVKSIKFPVGVRLAEDVEYNVRAFMQCRKIVSTNRIFYYYRSNPHSVTSSEKSGIEAVKCNIAVTEHLLNDFETFCIGPRLKQTFENYLIRRYLRYANKFGRIKDPEISLPLWIEYCGQYHNLFERFRSGHVKLFRLLDRIFNSAVLPRHIRFQIFIARFFL